MELNSREWALLSWIGIALTGFLLSTKLRPPLLALARVVLHPKIVDVVGLAALYSSGCAWVLWRAGVWDWANLKTTILWFFTTGFVAVANTKQLDKGFNAQWTLVREAITITAVVLFIGSINTMPFWAEFLLLPLLTLIGMMVAVAEHQPEHRIIVAPLNGIVAIAGLSIIGYSIYRVATDWSDFDTALQVREFVIPIALTVLFLPFLYGLILFIGFEKAATRLQFSIKDRALRRYVWLRGLLAFGANTAKLHRLIHAIQMSDGVDRVKVRSILVTLKRSMQREKSPPPVDWAEGWSPYAAIDFLSNHGLRAGHYHPTIINWSADSPYLKLDDGVLPDHLVYRIAGTETAVTELDLELDARWAVAKDDHDARFWEVTKALVLAALGDEPERRFCQMIPTDEHLDFPVGDLSITLTRDDWNVGERRGYSRTLTIRHPAFVDPFADPTPTATVP